MATEGIPVEVACRVVDMSVSGYYAWSPRSRSTSSAVDRSAHQRAKAP
jgi:hypothetical protein